MLVAQALGDDGVLVISLFDGIGACRSCLEQIFLDMGLCFFTVSVL